MGYPFAINCVDLFDRLTTAVAWGSRIEYMRAWVCACDYSVENLQIQFAEPDLSAEPPLLFDPDYPTNRLRQAHSQRLMETLDDPHLAQKVLKRWTRQRPRYAELSAFRVMSLSLLPIIVREYVALITLVKLELIVRILDKIEGA